MADEEESGRLMLVELNLHYHLRNIYSCKSFLWTGLQVGLHYCMIFPIVRPLHVYRGEHEPEQAISIHNIFNKSFQLSGERGSYFGLGHAKEVVAELCVRCVPACCFCFLRTACASEILKFTWDVNGLEGCKVFAKSYFALSKDESIQMHI